MGKKRTEACKHQSRMGAGWITAEQLVAEIICERQAKQQGIELLPRFWTVSPWDKVFAKNIALARRLTKRLGAIPLLRALESYQGQKVYSLTAKWFVALVEEEAAKQPPSTPVEPGVESGPPAVAVIKNDDIVVVRPQAPQKASPLSKLS